VGRDYFFLVPSVRVYLTIPYKRATVSPIGIMQGKRAGERAGELFLFRTLLW